jgi:hypothetical protein
VTKQTKGGGSGELSPLEMMRIVSLAEAARLSGLSKQSLRLHHPDKIMRLGKRKDGMRVRDAMMIKQESE